MDWFYPFYLLMLYFSAAISIALAVVLWRRSSVPGAAAAGVLLTAAAIWAVGNAMQMKADSLGEQIFWINFQFLGIPVVSVAGFIFSMRFTGREKRLTPTVVRALALEPILFNLLIWTNSSHHLLWTPGELERYGLFYFIRMTRHAPFWVHTIFAYSLVTAALFVLLRSFLRSSRGRRYQPFAILSLSIIPFAFNVLYIFNPGWLPEIDLTPFAIGLTTILISVKLRRYLFMDLIPLARTTVIDGMGDGVFILNPENHIVDINHAASRVIGLPPAEILGRSAQVVFASWPELCDSPCDEKTESIYQISVGQGMDRRIYVVSQSPLHSGDGSLTGYLVICRDHTERIRAEEALRRQLEEATILHSVATVCVESKREDQLIARVVEIIKNSMEADQFDIMLVKKSELQLSFQSSDVGWTKEEWDTLLKQFVPGQVLSNGASLRISDQDPQAAYQCLHPETRSELCVPIKSGERVIGVMNAESRRPNAFSASDERLLVTVAGQLTTAIERLHAESAGRHRVEELIAITRVSHEITSLLDRQKVLNSIVRHAAQISKSDASGVFTLESDQRFYLVASYGVSEDFVNRINGEGVPLYGTAVGQSVYERRPVQISDVHLEPDYATPSFAAIENIRSILALPMLRGEEVIGGIVLWRRQASRFAPEEELFLQALANQSVNALENARLFEAEREQRRLAESMREVGSILSATLDVDAVLDKLLDQEARIVPYDAGSLIIIKNGCGRIARMRGFEHFDIMLHEKFFSQSYTISESPTLQRIVETRQPKVIPDIYTDADWLKDGSERYFRSWAGIPVIIQERVVALFTLNKTEANYYRQEHINRLTAFAAQAALALQNAHLFDETQRRASHLEALNAVIAAAAAATDLNNLLELSLQHVIAAVGADGGGIRIGGQFVTKNIPRETVTEFGKIIREIKPPLEFPIVIGNWESEELDHPNLGIFKSFMKEQHVRASLAVSIQANNVRIGGISLAGWNARTWTDDELSLVQAIGSQLGAAIERLRLLEETQQRLKEVTLLSKIITVTATAVDMSSALRQVCVEVADFFDIPQTGFALLDPDRSTAKVIAEHRPEGLPSGIGLEIPIQDNPSMNYVLTHKTPLAVVDAQNDPLMAPVHEIMRARKVASILLVPILLHGEVIGTLGIDALDSRQFQPNELALMENIARQISQSLERLELFSAVQEHADSMARLARLSGELNRPLTRDEVLIGIGEGAMALANADRAALFTGDPETEMLSPWSKGLSQEYIQQVIARIKEIPGARIMDRLQPILIEDLIDIEENAPLRQMSEEEGFRSMALWPLIYEGAGIAVIGCYYDEPQTHMDEQREVMQAFARQAAVALENARLFEETRRRAAQQEALNDIIAAAAAAPNMAALLESVLKLTLKAMGVNKGGVWVNGYHVLRGFPEEVGRASAAAQMVNGPQPPATIALADWEQITTDQPLAAYAEIVSIYGVRATLSVPILVEGRRIGGLTVAQGASRQWTEEEIALLESIGRQIGSAAERLNLLARTQEQARQVQGIIDTVPEGVLLLDENLRIVLANPAAQDMLPSLVDQRLYQDLLTHLGDQPVEELLEQYIDQPWFELETTGPQRRVFEIAAMPLESTENKQGWVLVLRDVTQERENQSRIHMQDRLATVGQLAAGIAHDFNNIMAAIAVYADLLNTDQALGPTSRERVSIIQQQVERASSLIRQILDFSRRSVMDQSDLDMLPFIKELDKLLQRVLPETIRLELSYQPDSYMVHGDPTRLQQVFLNLAVNARDAMPEGGLLHFELERLEIAPGQTAPVPDLAPGHWIRIAIRDSGAGIPAEIIPRIFDPFFTTKPAGIGTGLGLAQVYGIVKQHKGSIDVTSQVGSGTTFYIYLPALRQHPMERVPLEDDMVWQGSGESLLLVEDDEVTRDAIQALLESQNYKVLTAANGVEALQIFEADGRAIQLVISDVVMPKMGGVPLYQTLRDRRPDIKMLLITGHPLDGGSHSMLEGGQVRWMQKPFAIQNFMRTLHSMLES